MLKTKSEISEKFLNLFRNNLVFLLLILIFIIFSLKIPGFFAKQNFDNISRQMTTLGLLSTGMTLAIIAGGIDLSVGAILALSITIGGLAIKNGYSLEIVYPLVIISSLFMGFINGFFISKLKAPPIIVTLGTMNVFRGIAMVITNGKWVSPIPPEFLIVGKSYIPFLTLAVVFIIFIIINTFWKFGRNLYAIGGNEIAASFSGVPVVKYKFFIYLISAFLSAIAGIIFVGRSGFIQPQVGIGYEMDAIAAVVVGGTSIWGGSGSIARTVLGTFFISIILNGLTMLGVNPYWKDAFIGGLILLAISIDSIRFLSEKSNIRI